MNKENILIYTPSAFPVSETFIANQMYHFMSEGSVAMTSQFDEKSNYSHKDIFLFNNFPLSVAEKIKSRLYYKILRLKRTYLHKNAEMWLNDFVAEHKIKLIHVHFGTSAELFLEYSKKHNLPILVSFHGFDASVSLTHKHNRDFYRELFRYELTYVIGVSSKMIARLEALGLASHKSKLIRYGIDTTKFSPLENKGNQNVIILHSGRLVGKKGVVELVEAFHGLSDKAELWLVGDGPLRKKVEKKITDLNLTNSVRMLGAVSNDEVQLLMSKADIFVLNSRIAEDGDREGVPVSLMEAMASGLAVISTYHEGISEIIYNQVNGILVSEKDTVDLSHQLENVVSDSDLRMKLGKNAREFAVQYLDSALMTKQISDFYMKIFRDKKMENQINDN